MATTTIKQSNDLNTAFRLKGNLFMLTVLQLLHPERDFEAQLEKTVQQAPKFFENAPVVIDLNELEPTTLPLDISKISKALRDKGLIPVGIRGGDQEVQQQAREAGLAILTNSALSQTFSIESDSNSKNALKSESQSKAAGQATQKLETKSLTTGNPAALKKRTTESTAHTPTKVITQPVRSGQQIYAKGGDLIVLSSVGHGAEILADGNIHVYGPLRGRALAGILGDTSASIFCQSLDAEMVSIAGRYLVNEQLDEEKNKGALHIYLEEDHLHFKTL